MIAARNPYRAGMIFLAVCSVLLVLALGINVSFGVPFNVSLWPPGTDYTLQAKFDDANGVTRGADVVIGGHSIGQVTGVHIEGAKSMVVMRINRQYTPLHKGTIARIRYSTLLAQKYIELAPVSTSATLPDGATIPSDQTITPVDFDQFLSSLDPATREHLRTLIQQAGSGVEGKQVQINDLLDQLHGLSIESQGGLDAFANHNSDVDSIIANLAITSTRLDQSSDNLADLVGNLDTVNTALAAQDAQLVALIHHLANVMSAFDVTLSGNEQNLHQTVMLLDPLVGQLNVAFGTTDGYLAPNVGNLQNGIMKLTPEAESAVGQRDANGNYLRQYLVADKACDSLNPTYNPSCGNGKPNPPPPGGSGSSSSAAATPQPGTAPNPGSGSGSGSGSPPAPGAPCDPILVLVGGCH